MEILSFDFDRFIDHLTGGERCEQYLRQHYSWFYSSSFPQMELSACTVDSIATGLYLRVHHCQSEHVRTLEIKQFVVDLSMVGLGLSEFINVLLMGTCTMVEGSGWMCSHPQAICDHNLV